MKKSIFLVLISIFLSYNSFSQIILNEDFIAGTLPVGWTITSVSSDSWEFGTVVDGGTNSSTIADASGNVGEYANIDFSDDPDTTSLVTPALSIAGLTNPRLTFEYFSQSNNSVHTPLNRLILDYWNGITWVNITVIDTLTTVGWTFYDFNISILTYGVTSDSVQFRFSAQEGGAAIGGTGTATYNQDLALDQVIIEQTPTCPKPISLASSNLTFSTIDVSWTEKATATEWYLEWDTAGFTPGTGRNTSVVTTTSVFTITGLNQLTSYDWNVKSTCALGDSSLWVSGVTFSTPASCLAPVANAGVIATSTSIEVSWVERATATSWRVEWDTLGYSSGTARNTMVVIDTFAILTGLTAPNSYDWMVQALCSATDSSVLEQGNAFAYAGAPLTGIYTVDSLLPTGGTNFQSFADLEFALNNSGVSGPVTVNVMPDTYNEDFALSVIPGASATNTIIIDGGAATTTTIAHDKSVRTATIVLFGSSYITIKNLPIITASGTTTTDKWGVLIRGNSQHVTIDSCIILLPVATTSDVAGILISGGGNNDDVNGQNAHYVTISNNTIRGGERGLSIRGSTVAAARNTNLIVRNNTITQADVYGIRIDGYDSVLVENNIIDSLNNVGSDAIYLSESENFNIVGNYGNGRDNGLDADDLNFDNSVSKNSTIINNMFIGGDDGIFLDDVEEINIFHNSSSAEDRGISFNDHANLDIRNNIFASNSDNAIFIDDAIGTLTLDNNIYYSLGTAVANVNGTAYNDLVAFVAGEPTLNANSLEGDPVFVNSLSDLHAAGILANNVGDNNVGVNVDIDGDTRPIAPSTIVDIGADEFFPPLCPPPTSLSSIAVGGDTATINWNPVSTTTLSQYSVVPLGNAPGIGSAIVTTAINDSMAGIGNLMALTTYDFYVREVCGRGDTSIWIQGPSFTTLCSIFSAPFIDGFENHPTASGIVGLSECWNGTRQNTSNDWNIDAGGSTPSSGTGPAGPYAGSKYLFFEATGGAAGASASFISPVIDISTLTSPLVEFYYFMFGDNRGGMGNLYVEMIDGGVTTTIDSIIGQQQTSMSDPWLRRQIPLPTTSSTDIQIVLRATRGTLTQWGDIAIDDFVIIDAPSCISPTGPISTVIRYDSALVTWTDLVATSWEVEWDLAGFTPGTATNSIVVSNDSLFITGLMSSTAYEWNIRSICGMNDTSNWAGGNFSTPILGPLGLNCATGNPRIIFSEEFDNNIAGWTGNIGSAGGDWEIPNASASASTGANSAHSGSNFMNFEASSAPSTGGAIVSPAIDLTTAQSDVELSFWIHAYGAAMGDLTIGVGSSPTGPFTAVFSNSGQIQISGTDAWQNAGVNLASYIGQVIYLEFNMTNTNGTAGDMSIDLVEVSTCVSCADPSNLTTVNTSNTVTDLSWIENGSATTWLVEYDTTGFTPGTGTLITTSANPYTLTGLTAFGNYDFYVRSLCAVGDTSIVVGPFSFTAGTLLSGVYTVDSLFPTGGTNFESFKDLEFVLNNIGVSGAVIVNVMPNTYNENFTLNAIPGASATNTITIDGGAATTTTIAHDKSVSNFTIGLLGTSYVTFKNLSVITASGTTATDKWGYSIRNNSQHITIDSCIVLLPIASTTDVAGIQISAQGANDDINGQNAFNIIISNNIIRGGERGITVRGSTVATARNTNLIVRNNTITQADDYGIRIDGYDSVLVENNIIDSLNNIGSDAIYLSETENFDILGNFGNGQDNGFDVDDLNFDNPSRRQSTIINNMFIGGDDGIFLDDIEDINIFHNSSSAEDRGISFNDHVNLDIRNNIFASNSDNAIFIDDAIGVLVLDYNVYYSLGTDVAHVNGVPYADLPAFVLGEPTLNTNSIEGDPIFINPLSDLHVAGPIADNVGDNSVGVMIDIDGDTRPLTPSTTVDIGADEFISSTSIESTGIISTTFSIHPNPTTGQFVIESSGLNNAAATVTVLDINGRVIKRELISNSNSSFSISINLNDSANGVYFITIQDGENLSHQKLIVK
ncbi:MAG: choice-of-anchor J domain-containing protein [Flavobacteriales bacterium]|nr:choice-of-anchor J domain-containing protein [Flavobacteriales bacterium]